MAITDVEITTDGRTVWVNTWRCLGRFTANMAEVMNIPGGWRDHDPDWAKWVDAMKAFHGVTVPEKYRPDWA